MDVVEAGRGGFFVTGEVDIDKVEEKFGGVDVKRHGVADLFKVGLDGGDGASKTEFSLREEVELVEEGEGGGGGLVDTGENDDLQLLLGGEEVMYTLGLPYVSSSPL